MKNRNVILISFIALKFLLQYVLINSSYDLHRDEYLHLDLGKHLAWGYLSVPPVISWISFLINLVGDGLFWVKFFPALFGALTLWMVWKIIEELKGNVIALIIGASGVLFSVLLRLNTLYQPNSLDVLCWTTFFFLLIRYLNTEKSKWLYGCAGVFAFGFLNKYNITFLVLGFVPALLLTKQRTLFLKKELYWAALLALALILPNLIWQYVNHFPVWHHLNQLSKLQLVNVNRLDFIKSQLLFFAGSVPVVLLGWYALMFHKPFERYRAFFWAIIAILSIFIWFQAKDYYAIGLYPVYIAFGAVYTHHIANGWRKALVPVFVILPGLMFIPMYMYAFPNKTPEQIMEKQAKYKTLGMLRWEDGKDHDLPQDFADMLGWQELAQKVDRAFLEINAPNNTLVLCDNYGQAGAINYYSRLGIRAVTFHADYINWFNLDKDYQHLIRIKDRGEKHEELKETSPFFNTAIVYDSITNIYSREFGTTIFSFKDATININERLRNEILEQKGKP